MANAKILEQKAQVVKEIKEKFDNAKSVVVFDYRGLSVSEVTDLRRKLTVVYSYGSYVIPIVEIKYLI